LKLKFEFQFDNRRFQVLHHGFMKEKTSDIQPNEALAAPDRRTRSRLIEAAGIVFSEKGYDRATAREICVLARSNPAAVNYHFGGKERLYVEVLREAHRRLMNPGALKDILETEGAPEDRLERFFSGLLHSMLDPSPAAWMGRLLAREVTAPTKALEEVVEVQIRPTSVLFRALVGRLMDLPADHPAVIRGALSTVGQFMFVFQNRRIIQLVMPELDLKPEGVDEMARHIWRYSVAGLRAVAEDAKIGSST
jgi:AcrR family transcriptional regulator